MWRPSHHLRLNRDFHSDLEWWHRFLKGWNGTSRCAQFDPKRPNVVIPLDRAGRWGCGAYPEEGDCSIQYKWQEDIVEANIKVKELLPIVMACAMWGREWTVCTVLAQCDNEAVVADINGGYSKENDIMHLLRYLFFSASFQLKIYAKNIPVKHNELADALSRKKFPSVSGIQADNSTAHTNPHTNPPTPSEVTHKNKTRLAITRLDVSVQKYMQHSVAESTHKVHSAA